MQENKFAENNKNNNNNNLLETLNSVYLNVKNFKIIEEGY